MAAEYEPDDQAIRIFAVERGGSHFHDHGDKHITSIHVASTHSFDDVNPFRITEASEVHYNEDNHELWLYLPEHLKKPKTYNGRTRDDSGGRVRHPISPLTLEDMIEMEEQIDYTHFDPKVFNMLLKMTKEYCIEHDVRLCLDEEGNLYGRIDGN